MPTDKLLPLSLSAAYVLVAGVIVTALLNNTVGVTVPLNMVVVLLLLTEDIVGDIVKTGDADIGIIVMPDKIVLLVLWTKTDVEVGITNWLMVKLVVDASNILMVIGTMAVDSVKLLVINAPALVPVAVIIVPLATKEDKYVHI